MQEVYYKIAANSGDNSAKESLENILKDADKDVLFAYAQILDSYYEPNINGITKNNTEAAKYYKLAADKGHIEAINCYIDMLQKGEGVGKNLKEALNYYFKLAKFEKKPLENILKDVDKDVLFTYANELLVSSNAEDKKKGIQYLKQAADLGNKEAKDKLEEYNKQNTLKQDKFKNIPVQQKPKSILTNNKSKPKEESLEDIRKSLVENYSKNIDRYIKALYRQASLLELDKNNKISRAAVKYYKTVLKYCENNGIKNLKISNETTININDLKNRIDELDSVNIKIENINEIKNSVKKEIENERNSDNYGQKEKKIKKRIDEKVAELIKVQLKDKYGFEFKEKLGAGIEGTAYLVEKDGEEFVIKIPNWSEKERNPESEKEMEEKNEMININKFGSTTIKDAINLKINGKILGVRIEMYEKKIDLDRIIHDSEERKKFKPFAFAARSLLNLNSLHNISNIIHRDLKPNNMLFDGKYLPELADFGLSKSMGEITHRDGALTYMSAELLNESTVNNVKTDVYSMGASIYEAFTGKKFHELLEVGERERVNKNNRINYAEKIDKKITKENIIDKIDFTKIFPNVNFNDKRNKKLLKGVQTELLKFFKGTLTANPNARFTTNEAMAQFRKVLKKCQKMVKTNGEKLDLTEDLGIPEQDLYRYGIFNDKIVGTAKNDYINNIENLLDDPNLISKETIECLKALLNNANKKEIDISFDDNFRKNLETLKEKDKAKYLLITKEMIELKKLKLASKINELKKQKNKYKNEKNKNEENAQKLEEVREYRRKLKELYNMSDMIIKIKQNKEMAKHLLSLESNDRTKEFEKACKNNNIFAVKVLLNSANKKEKENMIKNINTCYEGKNTLLYNLLNKDNMDKNDIRDAEFLIANGANFGGNILSYDDFSEKIRNNIKKIYTIVDDGINFNLDSMLNSVSDRFKNKNLNVLSDNLKELEDIDKLLGIGEESKTVQRWT